MNPYISIICPCYNGAAFIACAIQSVIRQPADCLELIIVDDGSTDDTGVICNQYVSESVRYFRTDNLGTGHARNYGLEQAKGTWIMYLDADDLYLLNAIDTGFIHRLNEYEKQDVDIVYTPCSYVDFGLRQWIRNEKVEELNTIPQYTFWNGIYSHAFLRNHRIRFYEYKEQDIESAFRYLTFQNARSTVTDNRMKFYLQRENYSSNTHTWDLRKVSEIKTLVYDDLIRNHADSTEQHDRLLRELLSIVNTYFIEVYRNGFENKKRYSEVCKIAKECLHDKRSRHLLGAKQYRKELARYYRCRLSAKEQSAADIKRPDGAKNDLTSEYVMDRLQLISQFLLNES